MSILKYVNRLQKIDKLIRMKATGPPDKFAAKLGINRAMLLINLSELRELGASISYCRCRRSYYYNEEFKIIIGNFSNNKDIYFKGGNNNYVLERYFNNYLQ